MLVRDGKGNVNDHILRPQLEFALRAFFIHWLVDQGSPRAWFTYFCKTSIPLPLFPLLTIQVPTLFLPSEGLSHPLDTILVHNMGS